MATAPLLLQAFDALLQPERFKDYGPNGLQVEGKERGAPHRFGRHGQPCADRGGRARAGRCDLRAPWPVLARPGWTRHGLDEAAAGAAAGARHQPVRLSPAARRASRAGQQRAAGAASWAWQPPRASASRTSGFLGARADGGGFAGAQALASHVREALGRRWCCVEGDAPGRSAVSRGAPAAPRATSRPPSPPAPMRSSPAKSPSRRRTTRANAAWLSWPVATTPASAMARRRWPPCGGAAGHRAPVHRHRQPGMSARIPLTVAAAIASRWAIRPGIGPEIIAKAFRDAPEATRGCFVAGDLGRAAPRGAGHPRRGGVACRWR